MFLEDIYKFPQRLWSNTDVTELSGSRNKSILVSDLNAKTLFPIVKFQPLRFEALVIIC
jgi:hypothetical protein